ncbi:MAG: (d)CMP kinase [Planctomycetes bacterium]|nr:(d)CMP kinase [Planctomycetota bacterium]
MPSRSDHNLPRVIITIDGPAGTGKSTVAHQLAKCLGLEFLDTGAMYRAAALVALDAKIDPTDGLTLASAVERIDMHFQWSADPPRLLLGDRDVSRRIRDLDVNEIVSIVAGQGELRRTLVAWQRRIAEAHPRLVSEGRDQGSVVFREADLRFYLDADIAIRAQRRARQLVDAGMQVSRDRIERDILQRDRMDESRADGPLVRPEGAIVLDTGDRSVDQVVTELARIAHEQLPDFGLEP